MLNDERYQRIRQRHAEYEGKGGWVRPFVNVAFSLTVVLLLAFSLIWYDGLHDIGEFAGVYQFVFSFLIGCLTLCLALICLTVTLIKYSRLRLAQRTLGILPIALFAIVCAAAYFHIPPFHG